MKLDAKTQVLLALYTEYQKDLPKMKNVTSASLDMDSDVFNVALKKLDIEGYITGLGVFASGNDPFYTVMTDNIMLTRDGIDMVENKLGIAKELDAKDKLLYIVKKCGSLALPALKLLAAEALKHISDIV